MKKGDVVRWFEFGCLGKGRVVKLCGKSVVVEDMLTAGREIRVPIKKVFAEK